MSNRPCVLVFSAHAADFVWRAGGAIAVYAARGHRVRILCSVYDPQTGQYRVSYALFLEIAGFLTFFLYIGWYLWKELQLRNKKNPGV